MFFQKIINRIRKLLFWFSHARKFKSYSFTSTMLDALKIQGHAFIFMGKKVYVHKHCWLGVYQLDDHIPELIINNGTCIGNYNHIIAVRSVHIGEKVLTAERVFISDNLHNFENVELPVMDQGLKYKNKVVIGDGAWIGENVCIVGASVGKNSVVGANSVVTADIPDYCVAIGSPARVIKKYDFELKRWVRV